MPTFINIQTGKPEAVADADMANALLGGSHKLAPGAVEVENPEGVRGTMPAENVADAIQAGYRMIGPTERAVTQYVDENKGIGGAAKVALTQFADEAAMGIPETVWEHTADPLERAKREALKKEHDLANTVGGIGGFGASMLIGGPLFKGATKAGQAATVATDAMATRLAEKAGFELGKGQATKIAKNIVSKAIGGGVEGAIVSSPLALTEAALGDPELGGEAILFGGGLGAMFGAGGALTKDILGLGEKAAKQSYQWLEGKAPTVENMRNKAAKIFTGVPEEDIEHYLLNKERINANEGRTSFDIMDDIDRSRAKYMDEQQLASNRVSAAKSDLDYNYKVALRDLAEERPALALGQEVVDDLSEARRVLGQQSEDADAILSNAFVRKGKTQVPVEFSRSDVLGRIRKEVNGLGAIVGEQKKATRDYLESLYGQIKEGYADRINGPDMRELMRTLRKENDSFWDREGGVLNSYAEKALLNVSEGMSDLIKRKVPLYGEKMAEMAPLARSLSEMQIRFGTIDRAMNALRGVTGEKGEILEGILRNYGGLRGKDFASKLGAYKQAKDLLRQSKVDDLSDLLLPNLSQKVKDAEGQLAAISSRNEPLSQLTPARTQSIIANLKRKVPNEKARRALEYLSELEGKTFGVDDYLSQIKDRHVLDSFDVERINGSRRTNLMGAMGAALGGAAGGIAGGPVLGSVGAAAGATIGAGLDVYGGKVLKKLLDGETFVGPLFVEKKFRAAANQLDKIPAILEGLGSNRLVRRMPKPVDATRAGLIYWLTGEEIDDSHSDRERKKRAVELMNDRLSEWEANPEKLVSDVQNLITPISHNGAPLIAGIGAQKLVQAISYLAKEVPKPPRMPSPFAPEVKWRPSDYDTKKFMDKVEVIQDPFSVLYHLENGSLTKSQTDALKTVYPALFEQMRTRIFKGVMNDNLKLNYTDRVKLSMLLGEPLDVNMTQARLQTLQSTFAPVEPPADTAVPMTGDQQNPINVSPNVASNMATDLTRRSMGA